ncbi:MAG: outer rane transport energization protein TonB [Chlorobi bacterium]|nr:outer rane transport energization protein TonB [Chlorobiota bacterium]
MRYSHSLVLCGALLLAGCAHGRSRNDPKQSSAGLDIVELQQRIEYPEEALKGGLAGGVHVLWFPADQKHPVPAAIIGGKQAALVDAVRRGLRAYDPAISIVDTSNALPERMYDVTFRLDSTRGNIVGSIAVAVPSAEITVATPESAPPGNIVKQEGPDEFITVENDPQWDQVDLQRRMVYPVEAQRNNIQGRVVLRALVSKTGQVADIHVDHSDNPLLTPAAVDAVRGTRFTPASQGGTPVAVWVQIPVTFKLSP